MRWERLFADLQAQLDAEHLRDVDAEIAELATAEIGLTAFTDRIRGCRDRQLTLRLADGGVVAGVISDATAQWVLLAQERREVLVPVRSVVSAWPMGGVAPPTGVSESKVGLGHALRALAAQERVVTVRTSAGDERGWIARVGADHVDLIPEDASEDEAVTVSARHVLAIFSS